MKPLRHATVILFLALCGISYWVTNVRKVLPALTEGGDFAQYYQAASKSSGALYFWTSITALATLGLFVLLLLQVNRTAR